VSGPAGPPARPRGVREGSRCEHLAGGAVLRDDREMRHSAQTQTAPSTPFAATRHTGQDSESLPQRMRAAGPVQNCWVSMED